MVNTLLDEKCSTAGKIKSSTPMNSTRGEKPNGIPLRTMTSAPVPLCRRVVVTGRTNRKGARRRTATVRAGRVLTREATGAAWDAGATSTGGTGTGGGTTAHGAAAVEIFVGGCAPKTLATACGTVTVKMCWN